MVLCTLLARVLGVPCGLVATTPVLRAPCVAGHSRNHASEASVPSRSVRDRASDRVRASRVVVESRAAAHAPVFICAQVEDNDSS